MLPSINDAFADDAADLIDLYGEDLVFRPFKQPTRIVRAVVKRMPMKDNPDASGKPRPWFLITFCTDPAAGGIDPATLDFSNSKIDVAYIRGGQAAECSFKRDIPVQTPNRWQVRVA